MGGQPALVRKMVLHSFSNHALNTEGGAGVAWAAGGWHRVALPR
jgi:hypothetical protein